MLSPTLIYLVKVKHSRIFQKQTVAYIKKLLAA
ncbi:hypothetical protein R615_08690 [Thalassolituus oleivorans R6-15]|nr:hypothetical protein R615_08690 [Thalassolituus oleivorans R6-15]